MGRTFQESVQKALRGLETGVDGFDEKTTDRELIEKELADPAPDRLWYVADAFRIGMSLDEVRELTRIDPWFLAQIEDIVRQERALEGAALEGLNHTALLRLKRAGFSDRRLAKLLGTTQREVRERRWALQVRPVFKRVDTCAAEFDTRTAYMYSTYEEVRGASDYARQDHGAGRRAQPYRPGDRIRLLLRARGAGAPGRRL